MLHGNGSERAPSSRSDAPPPTRAHTEAGRHPDTPSPRPGPLASDSRSSSHAPPARSRSDPLPAANTTPTQPAATPALVRAPGWQDAARGDVYEVWGSLDATFAADAPSVGTIRVRRAQLIERPGGLSAWMRSTHRAFAHACAPLPRDARSLVPGMAIGDDRAMPADLSDAMKKTSLTHLTAVSGSHIVIVLATVTLIVPARKPLRLGATILVLGTILILVGPDPSVVRSVCVAAVATLGLILGREGQSIAALCAVVIATLLIDPWASRSYGFALSALAALAVVGPSAAGAAVPPTNPRRHGRRESAALAGGDGVCARLRGAGDRADHRLTVWERAGVGNRRQRHGRARRSGCDRRGARGRARLPAEYSRRLGMRCRCFVGDRLDRGGSARVCRPARKRGARTRWILDSPGRVRLLWRRMDRVEGMEEMGSPERR